MTTNKIKVCLVDDHQIVRDGIKSLLTEDEEIQIIAEASNCNELFNQLKIQSPDILLMDISLPCKSGIELSREVLEVYPEVKVIMLSMYTDEEFVLKALKAGAKGYLPKNTTKREIREAIKTIFKGEEYFNETVKNILLKNFVKNVSQPDDSTEKKLSERELEVLKLYATGMSNKEIADTLFISIRTVESHKNHVMQKLKLKSTVDLIKYAIKNKIIEL